MARMGIIDDSEWPEVKHINNDAVFKGYLLLGVKGLGVLVIAWNTAVLLGGFVPNLEPKDFWFLTAISLIQAAGVVDFVLKEKFTQILFWIFHKLRCLCCGKAHESNLLVVIIKILGCLISLCLLAPVPVLGLYMSTGISVWRLIEHNYSNTSGSANLKPALYVLYSLAVAQGVLYGYKTIKAIGARIKQAEFVASRTSVDTELVLAYLDYIVAGCKKDPSFATGRNLVTYAIDLIVESKSNDSFIAGIRVLGKVIEPDRCPRGRLVLAKYMLTGSASFSHLIQRLLETLGPRSPYSREIREHGARVVALVAGGIHLEQHPGGIDCISSLLDTFKVYRWRPGGHWPRLCKEYERDWLLEKYERDYLVLELGRPDSPPGAENNPILCYARLVIQGLRILRKLAVDKDNCRVITNTEGLLSKITRATLFSNHLHRDYHDEWHNMLQESLELIMIWLMAATKETRTRPPDGISGYSRATVNTLKSILQCSRCSLLHKRKATEILLLLDPSSVSGSGISSRKFMWVLLDIVLLEDDFFDQTCASIHRMKKRSYIRRLAEDKLQAMLPLPSDGSATSKSKLLVGYVLGDLTEALVAAGNNTDRLHAAEILGRLCLHYNKQGKKFFNILKEAMIHVMPKVLKEIFSYATREGQAATEANNVQENGEQLDGSELREALIFLCWVIWVKWYRLPDTGTTRKLDEVTANLYPEQGNKPRFGELVIEARELLKPKKEAKLGSIYQPAFQVKPKYSCLQWI
ncbi:hypothetical protein ACP70R_032677 [Stipagrostis hirtigluma subsp. patula]